MRRESRHWQQYWRVAQCYQRTLTLVSKMVILYILCVPTPYWFCGGAEPSLAPAEVSLARGPQGRSERPNNPDGKSSGSRCWPDAADRSLSQSVGL